MSKHPHSRAWNLDSRGSWWRPATHHDAFVIIDGDNDGYVLAGSPEEADRIDVETFGAPAPMFGQVFRETASDTLKALICFAVFPALYFVIAMGIGAWFGRI